MSYTDLILGKRARAQSSGFTVSTAEIHPSLFPHQADAVDWMCAGGRRALFFQFGMGKTRIQIEALRQALGWVEYDGPALVVLPLGVRAEFEAEAAEMGVPIRYVRNDAEAAAAVADGVRLHTTNYERVRDGHLTAEYCAALSAVSLDEASVLRSFGSKTYHAFNVLFEGVPLRFVATATPAPNRLKELIHYAGFLGVMDTGQALTRFFQRNSEKAGDLTLMPHMEAEFWRWVGSWALYATRPSDLDPQYSDDGYDLPPIDVRWHTVAVDHSEGAGEERDGQARLFRSSALGVRDAAREKRETIADRLDRAIEIVASAPDRNWVVWHHLEDERRAIEAALPKAVCGAWHEYRDGHQDALDLYDRHYSAREYADGRERKLLLGPGEKTVLLTADRSALCGWRKFTDDSGQEGVNCAVFRNEGDALSSDLLRDAMAAAWDRWPGERLYTYVDADAVESDNPGYCFKVAGWRSAGHTKGGLAVLEALPGDDAPAAVVEPYLVTAYGSQDLDDREAAVVGFAKGRYRVLATKPSIAGSGCNLQAHCSDVVFLGLDYSFNDFIQAVHRVHRFGQTRPVTVHVITAESEAAVVSALRTKWALHEEQGARMREVIRRYGLSGQTAGVDRAASVERAEATGDRFVSVRNDCVTETAAMPDASVGMILTSVPFSDQYEYTPSLYDFGYNDGDAAFFEQMAHLVPELLRVLQPGRVCAVHVKDRVRFARVTGKGAPTVSRFSDRTADAFEAGGFEFFGRITVATDVVRENNQTYRLGWTEMCKDGTKMGVGMCEYVLLFRRLPTDTSDGYADVPVSRSKADYSRARWQTDASGFWRSSGDRLLTAGELAGLSPSSAGAWWREHHRANVYDHEAHVALAEGMEEAGALPSTFALLGPEAPAHVAAGDNGAWTDVSRMRTLNSEQSRRREEQHVCPLQLDVVERLVRRFSAEGDVVYDPFAGLHTVPYVAVRQGRRGLGVELNPEYWRMGAAYCRAAEVEATTPTLFDLSREGAASPAPEVAA